MSPLRTWVAGLVLLLCVPQSVFAYPLEDTSESVADPDSAVEVVLQMADGSTYIGGTFAEVDGTARPLLALINPAGVLDTTFNPTMTGTYVGALVLSEDGNTLYVGGDFTNAGGQARTNLAALNKTTGLAVADWAPNPDGAVAALALNTDDDLLYVGGSFANIDGSARNDAAAINTAAGTVHAWDPGGTSVGVNFILYEGTTDLVYIGGSFSAMGGASRANLVAVGPTNGVATAFQADTNAEVLTLAIDVAANRLYVGGAFTEIAGGASVALAKVNATTGGGTLWNPGADGEVAELALDLENDALYVAGSFNNIGGVARDKFVELDSVGGLAAAFDPNPGSFVYALSYNTAAETLAAGGAFETMGGQAQLYFARFTIAAEPATSTGSSYIPIVPPGVTVLAPNGGEALVPGSVTSIEWKIQGRIDLVNIQYSLDGGLTWTTVSAAQPVGASRFTWTVPSTSSRNALVRVEATDMVVVYASDESDAVFQVGTGVEVAPEPALPTPAQVVRLARSPESSTVYVLDEAAGTRRPFLNEISFFSHGFSFGDVGVRSSEELASMPLGAPMLPKAGSVLVKLESVPVVYLTEQIEGDATRLRLRPIMSETDAALLGGPYWADYVIDLPVTAFSRMVIGESANASVPLDQSLLRRRVDLK